MIRLTSETKIGDYIFRGLVGCEIESSWDTLTDTCKITVPRRISWAKGTGSKKITDLVHRGDPVTVALGYDDRNISAFEGYVKKVGASIPIEIECEDVAWLLKKDSITKSYKTVDLSSLLSDLLPDVVPIASQPDYLGLGPFRISNATPAKVLDKIKQEYFQKFWFRNSKLYAGLAYWPATSKTHSLNFQSHVVNHQLVYLDEKEVRIKLKIISISEQNEKKEFEFGDPDGEQRTVYFYNKKEQDIKAIANEQIERMRFTGYRGSLTTFGEPFINHGDVVELADLNYPERDGSYFVKSVKRLFGVDGYRQELSLDMKIAA